MNLQREFIVRYQDAGHVRFQVPQRVCESETAARLTAGILAINGVYRVRLFTEQGKLSIRFHSQRCTFKQLARQLAILLAQLETQYFQALTVVKPTMPQRWIHTAKIHLRHFKVSRWLNSKVEAVKETAQAAKVLTQLSKKAPQHWLRNPEKLLIDFFNDIVVLFLIKTYWKTIVQQWLPNPIKYRYQWLTVFYAAYLLLRSRRFAA